MPETSEYEDANTAENTAEKVFWNFLWAQPFLESIRQRFKKPRATYVPAADTLLVVRKDCNYTPEMITPVLDILWDNHPEHEGSIVGFRLHGVRWLLEKTKERKRKWRVPDLLFFFGTQTDLIIKNDRLRTKEVRYPMSIWGNYPEAIHGLAAGLNKVIIRDRPHRS